MAPWAYLPCLDLWRHESPADGRATAAARPGPASTRRRSPPPAHGPASRCSGSTPRRTGTAGRRGSAATTRASPGRAASRRSACSLPSAATGTAWWDHADVWRDAADEFLRGLNLAPR